MPTHSDLNGALLLALLNRAEAGGSDVGGDLDKLMEFVDDPQALEELLRDDASPKKDKPASILPHTTKEQCRPGMTAARTGCTPKNRLPGSGKPARLRKPFRRLTAAPQQAKPSSGPVAAGLAVVAQDSGRVLLMQRQLDPEDKNSGKWEFPGGKIDEGEKPLEAAVREWTEEVGLSLPPGKLAAGREWLATNGKYQGYVYYVAREADVDIQNRQADADADSGGWAVVAWVDPKDVEGHNLRPELLADKQQVMANIAKFLTGQVRKVLRGAVTKRLVTKAPCNQGQTAAQTGCTPQQGGGGGPQSQSGGSAVDLSNIQPPPFANPKNQKLAEELEEIANSGDLQKLQAWTPPPNVGNYTTNALNNYKLELVAAVEEHQQNQPAQPPVSGSKYETIVNPDTGKVVATPADLEKLEKMGTSRAGKPVIVDDVQGILNLDEDGALAVWYELESLGIIKNPSSGPSVWTGKGSVMNPVTSTPAQSPQQVVQQTKADLNTGPLPKLKSGIDTSGWSPTNSSAKFAANKIKQLEDLASAGKWDEFEKAKYIPTSANPNTYQKKMVQAYQNLLAKKAKHTPPPQPVKNFQQVGPATGNGQTGSSPLPTETPANKKILDYVDKWGAVDFEDQDILDDLGLPDSKVPGLLQALEQAGKLVYDADTGFWEKPAVSTPPKPATQQGPSVKWPKPPVVSELKFPKSFQALVDMEDMAQVNDLAGIIALDVGVTLGKVQQYKKDLIAALLPQAQLPKPPVPDDSQGKATQDATNAFVAQAYQLAQANDIAGLKAMQSKMGVMSMALNYAHSLVTLMEAAQAASPYKGKPCPVGVSAALTGCIPQGQQPTQPTASADPEKDILDKILADFKAGTPASPSDLKTAFPGVSAEDIQNALDTLFQDGKIVWNANVHGYEPPSGQSYGPSAASATPGDKAGLWTKTAQSLLSDEKIDAENLATALKKLASYTGGDLSSVEATWKMPAGMNPLKVRMGGVVFNDKGQVLLREPANHFGGYVWTFPKGTIDPGAGPVDTALKEVLEETGQQGAIIGFIPGLHKSGGSTNAYFAMKSTGEDLSAMQANAETWQTKWVDFDEAEKLIKMTKIPDGVARDLAVLAAAKKAWEAGLKDKQLAGSTQQQPPVSPGQSDITGWQQTGSQQGSNDGGKYKDKAGKEWYLKFSKSEAHAKNEVCAAKLYELANAGIPDYQLVKTPKGMGTASAWLTHSAQKFDPSNPQHKEAAIENFGVHCWLGNLDAVGASFDNQTYVDTPQGPKLITIDTGGAMLFRAQGKPKGTDGTPPFDENVVELQSMLNPNLNSTAATVFGGMTPEQKLKAYAKVAGIGEQQIKVIVEQFGPGDGPGKQKLFETLVARKNAIVKEMQALHAAVNSGKPIAGTTATTPVGPASKLPPKPPTPGFTGIDANGHHWVNGVQVAKPQQATSTPKIAIPPKPIINNPTYQAQVDKIWSGAQKGINWVETIKTNPTSNHGYTKKVHKYKMAVLAALKSGAVPQPGQQPTAATGTPPTQGQGPSQAGPKTFQATDFTTTQPYSSKPEKSAAILELLKLAMAGDLTGLQNYQPKHSAAATSTTVTGYKNNLIAELQQLLNPPPPPKPYQGQLDHLKKVYKNITDPTITEKIGYFIVTEEPGIPSVSFPKVDLKKSSKYDHKVGYTAIVDQATHDQAYASMSTKSQQKLKSYTGYKYGDYNSALHGGVADDDLKEMGKEMVDFGVTLTPGTYLSRKLTFHGALLNQILTSEGKVLQETAMSSTSIDPIVWHGNVQFNITAGPGLKGIYADKWSSNTGEKEMLLPPGTRYLVTKVHKVWNQNGCQHAVDVIALPTVKGQCC